ncbi:MAG: metallophosphoesterase [Bdellovibrionales bacterium]
MIILKNLIAAFFLSLSLSAGARSLQIVAVGDTGKANEGQKRVATAMGNYCRGIACDYGLLLGDNLYQEGMLDTRDKRMDLVFRDIYGFLNFPFFVTLGNHDYGKLSQNWTRGRFQVEYGKRNSQFILPSFWYIKEFEHVVLVGLDTTRMMWSKDIEPQKAMMKKAIELSKGKFLIVFGHHPYLSNGKHGNAGKYDGFSFPSFASGRDVKRFFEEIVCGKAHLYLSGHDHNLQMINGNQAGCKTQLIVSGAGATSTQLFKRNLTQFESTSLGFVGLTIEDDIIRVKFVNDGNQVLFETTIVKN